MGKGEMYNLALAYLGKQAYEAGTADAKAIEGIAQHCIALAFADAPWSFATKSATLEVKDGVCELPADCLRVLKVSAPTYTLRGRSLCVEKYYADTEIEYVSDEYVRGEDMPKNQPIFCEAVALMIAAKAAPRLTSDFTLAAELEQRAKRALDRAKLKDTRQWASNDQQPAVGNIGGFCRFPDGFLLD